MYFRLTRSRLLVGVSFALPFLTFSCRCLSQDTAKSPAFPSKDEITELTNKAEEKVAEFERVLKASSPAVSSDMIKTDLEAATTARTIIATIRKNGASAYSLVVLVSTLDDIALDATKAALTAMMVYAQSTQNGSGNNAAMLSVVGLTDSEKAVNDISELLLHVTLRFVDTEEMILHSVFKDDKP